MNAYLKSIVRLAGKGRQGVGIELFRLDSVESEEIELTDCEEEIASESGSSVAVMRVYESIGENFWTGEGITAKSFAKELDGLGSIKKLNIHINCLGGDCHTAQAIHSILADYRCNKKTSYIDGVCASAATLIASAADEVVARHNTNYMVHYPWAVCVGNADAMTKAAEDLEKLTIPIVSVYKEKVNGKIDEDKIRELMANETWMTADEAFEYGFVDKVRGKIRPIAKASKTQIFCSGQLMNFAKYKYRNFPNYPMEEIEEPKKESKMERIPLTDPGHNANVSLLIDPKQINLEYLSTNHASLVASIIDGERKRINDLDAMDGPGLGELITAAKADGRKPSDIAMECLTLTRKQLDSTNQLNALKKDSTNLNGIPAGDAPTNKPESKKEKGIAMLTKAQSSLNKRFQVKTTENK